MRGRTGAGGGVIELDALVGAAAAACAWAQRRLRARQEELFAALPKAAGAPLRVALPGGEVVETSALSLISPCVHELAELELALPCRPAELVHRGVRRLGLFLVAPDERPVDAHVLRIVVAGGPPLRAELHVDRRYIRGGAIGDLEVALMSTSHRPAGRAPIRCVVVGERDVEPVAGALAWSRPAV